MSPTRPKQSFRPGRPARDTPGYPEVLPGRRRFLQRLGLLGGGAAAAAILYHCDTEDSSGKPKLPELVITPASPTVDVGGQLQLKATFTDSAGAQDVSAAAAWSSDDLAVATVDANGAVTGVAGGFATIGAEHKGSAGSASLTVRGKPVSRLELSPQNPSLATGGQVAFVATARYTDGTSEVVTTRARWSSHDPAVATVSNDAGSAGRASAMAPGSTTINASLTTDSGVFSATTQLTVTA